MNSFVSGVLKDFLPDILSLSDDMPLELTHDLTEAVPNDELSIYLGAIQDEGDMLLSKEYIDKRMDEADEHTKLPELLIRDAESEDEFYNDSEQEGMSIANDGDHEADINHKIIYESEEIPELLLDNDNVEFPENIQDFHDDMPRIAHQMDGIDLSLVDDGLWEMKDASVIPEVRESHATISSVIPKAHEKEKIVSSQSSFKKPKITVKTPKKNIKRKGKQPSKNGEVTAKKKNIKVRNYLPTYKDPEMKRMIDEINDDLLKKLNQGSKKISRFVPWKRMSRDDLINWPEKIPIVRTIRQGRASLTWIRTNLDIINFTQDFLDRWASGEVAIVPKTLSKNTKNRDKTALSNTRKKSKAKKDASTSMQEYGSNQKISNTGKTPIPILPYQNDQFISQENIHPEISRLASKPKPRLIDQVNHSLLKKLNEATGSGFRYIPWIELNREDLVNWPWGIRLVRPSQFGIKKYRKF